MMSGGNQTACQNTELSPTRNQLAEKRPIPPTVQLFNYPTNSELSKHCRQSLPSVENEINKIKNKERNA